MVGGPMRVQVLRVSGMPHNVQVWSVSRKSRLVLHIDKRLITDEGARLLEAMFSLIACHWDPAVEHKRPFPGVHTG